MTGPTDISPAKDTSKKSFRFKGKRVFLTYSQIPDGFTKEGLLNHMIALCYGIKGGTDVTKYHLGEETHKDGGRHIHAVFWFSKVIDTVNTKFFDYLETHPNISAITTRGDPIDLYRYIMKEDPEPLSSMTDFRYPYEIILEEATDEISLIRALLKRQTSMKSHLFVTLSRKLFELENKKSDPGCIHNPRHKIGSFCLFCDPGHFRKTTTIREEDL